VAVFVAVAVAVCGWVMGGMMVLVWEMGVKARYRESGREREGGAMGGVLKKKGTVLVSGQAGFVVQGERGVLVVSGGLLEIMQG
jgi:hypothetical protein